MVVVGDSDESIGRSISQRGVQCSTPRKRSEKENHNSLRRFQYQKASSSRGVAINGQNSPRRPRKKNFWTPEETDLVRRGFNRYGTTCRRIRERYFPQDRLKISRDKIKTMQRRGELPYL